MFTIPASAYEEKQANIYPLEYAWEEFWYEEAEPSATFTGDFPVRSALLMEASTGRVLYANNEHEKLPIASVTKIMATLLVMEAISDGRVKLTDMVTVSDRAAHMGGSQVYLEFGEQMSVDDMLKALIVVSANDATVALAEHIYGSEETFIAEMNQRAKDLGMNDTNFINTNGLDAEGHYSSAYDVALMTRALLKYPLVLEYTTIWMDTIRNGEFGLANTNKLIRFYKGANGMKTGFTSIAKYCLSGTAKRDGMQLIAVVLGGDTSDERFACTKRMLDFGFANYTVVTPDKATLEPISITGGVSLTTGLDYTPPSLLIEKGKSGIETKFEISESLDAPVAQGEIAGVVRYYLNGVEIGNAPIFCVEANNEIDFWTVFGRIWKNLLGIG
ncbi:MAG TPA: D-alanyl-D-alanine carboxypeptidase [Clostridiales bacterium]|nr:D-alanyl-D-alanine carboxypeptidase [Clostridiales bacterium]